MVNNWSIDAYGELAQGPRRAADTGLNPVRYVFQQTQLGLSGESQDTESALMVSANTGNRLKAPMSQ